MAQNKVTVPVAKIIMKSGEEIIITREKGIKLQEALANATQHLFVNLTEHGRTINTTELKEVDTTAVQTTFEEVDDEKLAAEADAEMRKKTPEERGAMVGRFKLLWIRRMLPILGFYVRVVPDDVVEKARKMQTEFYKKHKDAIWVPDEAYEQAGLFEPIQ